MADTLFLMTRVLKVATEMALTIFAYTLRRVMHHHGSKSHRGDAGVSDEDDCVRAVSLIGSVTTSQDVWPRVSTVAGGTICFLTAKSTPRVCLTPPRSVFTQTRPGADPVQMRNTNFHHRSTTSTALQTNSMSSNRMGRMLS